MNLPSADTIATNAHAALVADAQRAIESAERNGGELDAARDDLIATLTRAWDAEGYRIEAIVRTALQRAYAAARREALEQPEVLQTHPFWRFEAVLDAVTTEECRSLHGTIRPANDPWWDDDHTPPLHYNCRSGIQPLTEEEARRCGGMEEPPDLLGTAAYSKYDGHFRPNPQNAQRTIEEALAIAARQGINLDPEVYRVVEIPDPPPGPGGTRIYGRYFPDMEFHPGEVVPWRRIVGVDGLIVIQIAASTLQSDEAIVNTLAHEYYESDLLREEFLRNSGRLRAERLWALAGNNGTFHRRAIAFADKIIGDLRGENPGP